MKFLTCIILTIWIAIPAVAADSTTNDVMKQLIAKYDINGNGKIDISERKAFLKELNHIRQEQRKSDVQAALKAPRIDGFPAAWDLNHDGKVDNNEIRQAQKAVNPGISHTNNVAGEQRVSVPSNH